jgi:alpha-mannosidase
MHSFVRRADPFGHSNTEAWLLGAEAGFESLYWGRTDYQDMAWRTSWQGQAANQWPEWIWQGSASMGKSAELFAGQLTTHGYGAPIRWDTEGGAIQDNPSRHDYNLDSMMDEFISAALTLQNTTRGNHQMWPCGSDFQYQNAGEPGRAPLCSPGPLSLSAPQFPCGSPSPP